jgi:hypothetical protein
MMTTNVYKVMFKITDDDSIGTEVWADSSFDENDVVKIARLDLEDTYADILADAGVDLWDILNDNVTVELLEEVHTI